MGPSGSGKSTITPAGGLDGPSDGESRWPGAALQAQRSQITTCGGVGGFIFQFYNLLPTFPAREHWPAAADRRRNLNQHRAKIMNCWPW
jgi:ABC-type lipoprotein export system ATPase subunit